MLKIEKYKRTEILEILVENKPSASHGILSQEIYTIKRNG